VGKGHVGRACSTAAMGTGGLNYICPTCGNPLFFTFRVVETREGLRKPIHCPGCRTLWVVDLKMTPRKPGESESAGA
jgi:DNA-directed RNA polymerase subunit RPC12/RpoP